MQDDIIQLEKNVDSWAQDEIQDTIRVNQMLFGQNPKLPRYGNLKTSTGKNQMWASMHEDTQPHMRRPMKYSDHIWMWPLSVAVNAKR